MKRLISLIMAVLMLASLCACAKNTTTTTPTNTEPNTEEATMSPSYYVNNLVFGEHYDTSYSNESLKIGFSLPPEWSITNTTKLAEMNEMDEEEMIANFHQVMKDHETATMLYAESDDGASSIEIIAQNLEATGHKTITADEYMEIFEEPYRESLEEEGATDIIVAPSTVYISNIKHTVRLVSYTMDDKKVYQEQVLFPFTDYMVLVIMTGDTETILNRIYSLY